MILHSHIPNSKKRERESPKQDQHRDYQLNPGSLPGVRLSMRRRWLF